MSSYIIAVFVMQGKVVIYARNAERRRVSASWSAAAISSRAECMAKSGTPTSCARTPRRAETIEPRVEPPGISALFE